MITPPTRLCTWSHTQTLHLVSLVHSLQGKPLPDPTHALTCPQSPQ